MLKHWYHVELPRANAEKFRVYIVEHGLEFEMSEAGNLTHVTVSMTADERLRADVWLKENCKTR